MASAAIVLIGLTVVSGVMGAGQWMSANASCAVNKAYSWAYNSLEQSPCVVSQLIIWANVNPGFTLGECGAPNGYYGIVGPASWRPGPWSCNDPLYSLMSACCDCQGGTWSDWTTWTNGCNGTTFRSFAGTLPSGTVIPRWAEMDIETNKTFSPTAAKQYALQLNFSSNSPVSVVSKTVVFISTTISATDVSSLTSIASIPTEDTINSHRPSTIHIVVGVLCSAAAVAAGVIGYRILYRHRKRVQSVGSLVQPFTQDIGHTNDTVLVATEEKETTMFWRDQPPASLEPADASLLHLAFERKERRIQRRVVAAPTEAGPSSAPSSENVPQLLGGASSLSIPAGASAGDLRQRLAELGPIPEVLHALQDLLRNELSTAEPDLPQYHVEDRPA